MMTVVIPVTALSSPLRECELDWAASANSYLRAFLKLPLRIYDREVERWSAAKSVKSAVAYAVSRARRRKSIQGGVCQMCFQRINRKAMMKGFVFQISPPRVPAYCDGGEITQIFNVIEISFLSRRD